MKGNKFIIGREHYKKGRDLYNIGNIDINLILDHFRISANLGNANAQYELGLFYKRRGPGLDNKEQAAEYFKAAAKQGYAEALYETGLCYEKGYGIFQNLNEAVKCYQAAANQDHNDSMKRIKILSETFSSIKEHLDSNIHQIITSFMDVDENQEGLNRNNIITEFLSKIETYLYGKTAEIYEQKESLAHINPRNYFYNDFMEKLITESLKEGITDDQMNKLNEMVKILKERFEFGMDIGGLKNFLDVSIENNASNKLIEDLQKFCQIAPMDYLLKLGKSYIEISRTKENPSEKEELAKKGIATLRQIIDQSNSPETIRFQTQATGITATCFIFGIGAENSTKDVKVKGTHFLNKHYSSNLSTNSVYLVNANLSTKNLLKKLPPCKFA